MHALIYSGPPDSPIALFAGYDPFNGLPWRHALPRFLIFNAYLLGLLLTAVYLMARLLRLGMDRLRLLLGVNVGVYAALTLGLALVTAPLHGYTTHLAHLRCKDNMAEIHSQLADQMKKHGGRLPAAATADGLFDALGLAGHQRRCHAGRVFFDDSRQLSVNTSLLGKGAGALRAAGDAVVVGCPYHAIGAEVKDTPLFRENIWLLSAVLASDLAGPKWNRQLAVQQEHWLRIKNMWDQRVRH